MCNGYSECVYFRRWQQRRFRRRLGCGHTIIDNQSCTRKGLQQPCAKERSCSRVRKSLYQPVDHHWQPFVLHCIPQFAAFKNCRRADSCKCIFPHMVVLRNVNHSGRQHPLQPSPIFIRETLAQTSSLSCYLWAQETPQRTNTHPQRFDLL